MRWILIIILGSWVIVKPEAQIKLVRTFAGGSAPLDGIGVKALLSPFLAVSKGNFMYFSDRDFTALRRLNLKTKLVETLLEKQNLIAGIALSNGGDSVYFSTASSIIKRYRISSGRLDTIVALPDNEIDALICDRKGQLFIGGSGHRVLLRDSSGNLKIIAGKLNQSGSVEGIDSLARFNKISSFALSKTEDTLFISDRFNSRIRRLVRSTGLVSSLVNVPVFGPHQLTLSKKKDTLYIANASGHNIVRYIIKANAGASWCGLNSTFGYQDGRLANSRFFYPRGICLTDSGLMVCDNSNRRIRQISHSGLVKTFAGIGVIGNGQGVNSRFNGPYDIVKHPRKDTIYISDQNNHVIRFMSLKTGLVGTLVGNGYPGNVLGTGQNSVLNRPINMAISHTGDSLYFTEPFSNTIKLVLTKTAEVSVFAGKDSSGGFRNGNQGKLARFNRPQDISLKGGFLYVADLSNHKIRKINVVTTEVSTFAGSTIGFKDSSLLGTKFNRPITLEWVGEKLFVGEDGGLRIRVVYPDSQMVKVWAGNGNLGSADGLGTAARFRGISKITYDPISKKLFIGGFLNEGVIRTVGVSTADVGTFVNNTGFADGLIGNSKFTGPVGVFVDTIGKRYFIADANNNRIRTINLYVNSPPIAKVDTLLEINEDQGIIQKSNFATQITAGLLKGDTLQKIFFQFGPVSSIQNAEIDSGGKLTLQTKPDSNGTFRIRIKLKDNGGVEVGGIDSSIYYTRLIIRPINDAPTFELLGNDTALNTRERRVSGFFKGKTPGPWDERNQILTLTVENDRPNFFVVPPFLRNDTLIFTPNPTSLGMVNVVVNLRDNGGTSFGGVDVKTQTFTILLVDVLSVADINNKKWFAYPNPAREEIRFINFPQDATSVQWYNPMGQKVEESKIDRQNDISTAQIPKGLQGIYFIRNNGSQFARNLKIVIE